jgi:hypothetical protein
VLTYERQAGLRRIEIEMTLPAIPELLVFMALVLILALYGLTVSGHFPAEFREPDLKTGSGNAIIWGSIALSALTAFVTLALAWYRLPLAPAIIGGGAMILFAPLLLQPLPDSFVDGRQGLIIFAGLGAALALLGGSFLA